MGDDFCHFKSFVMNIFLTKWEADFDPYKS